MALTKDDLQAIAALMDSKLEPIAQRLERLEMDMAEVKENTEVTRSAVNGLIEWADEVAVITQIRFPVKKKKAE